jgi:class 3 adenylate cyclase/tetratricopeptide (TPR) repeat protein
LWIRKRSFEPIAAAHNELFAGYVGFAFLKRKQFVGAGFVAYRPKAGIRGIEHSTAASCYGVALVDCSNGRAKVSVEAWLMGLGLAHYAEAFAENGVDLGLLPELTNEDLKDLGVDRLADRKVILKAIASIAGSDSVKAVELPAATAIAGERRQVTVLFADIAGYTKLSSELGAEATHALLNRYFEAVDGIIEGYGGSVDKHIGDNVMAVFGAPIAHGDDPLRAVRAALDIHERMTALADHADHPLSAHVGIASGQVVASSTGSDAHREYTVTGDSVNLASRLQDQAKPGETLISDALYRSVAERFDCESLGDIEVKGFDAPVHTWRVGALCESEEVEGHVAFVGRRAELTQFSGAADACRANGNGQAIVVRGEAGIGKTRLVEEFTRVAADHGFASHRGLVLDFGVGKGQDAIRSVVHGLLGVGPGGDWDQRRAAAEAAICDGVCAPEKRVFLNDLLDLPQSAEDRAMYDAMDNAARNEGMGDVVADLIRAASAASPIVVIVEDVHWADPLMLGHLAAMATAVADSPTLLVMTSRIEGDPLDAAWRASIGGCPLMTIDLGPLRRDEALTLAGTFVDATNQFAQDCIERASGNPLFLEQLLRNAEERGEEEVPASIQSLVLARMDRLTPADKRALQAASVIGQRFALDALQHLLDDPDYRCAGLLKQNLVRPAGAAFLFAHALIQEGVYGSLLKAQRDDLHRLAAAWFTDSDAVLHAEHFDRAGDENAPMAYLVAASEQAQQFHYERALELVVRGLEIAPEAVRYDLKLLQGELLRNLGSLPDSIAAYQEAAKLAPGDPERCRAWIGVAEGLRITDELDELVDLLARAESLAAAHDMSPEIARILQLQAGAHYMRGEVADSLRANEKAIKHARDAGSAELEAQALSGLADAEFLRARMISANGHYHACIELARAHGFGRIVASNLAMKANTLFFMNENEAAAVEYRAAIELAVKARQPRAEMLALAEAGFYMGEAGHFEDSRVWSGKCLEMARRLGSRLFRVVALHGLAAAALHDGNRAEADAFIREAIDVMGNGDFVELMMGPIIHAKAACVTEDPKRCREALQRAEGLLGDHSHSYSYLCFYQDALDVSLTLADWEEVARYIAALEDYTSAEPLPWGDLLIARARALSAHGQGARDKATMRDLQHVYEEAKRVNLRTAVPALEAALSAA